MALTDCGAVGNFKSLTEQDIEQASQAEIIFAMLTALYPECKGHVGDLLEYALCDLRHFSDKHQLSFASTDQAAHRTYLSER